MANLSNLTPSTIYEYKIKIINQQASSTTSEIYRFTTDIPRTYRNNVVKISGSSTIYYIDGSGKKSVVPNAKTYLSWYSGYSGVKIITQAELNHYTPGGDNITYKPGVRLLKITTDPKVYAVSDKGTLHWITTEALAIELYGTNWASYVDDLPDTFYRDYEIGSPIESVSDYDKAWEIANAFFPYREGIVAE